MELDQINEIWPTGIAGAKNGALIVTSSALGFYFLSLFILYLIPEKAKHSNWRWKNITVSLVHSTISATWACLCFYMLPEMAEDMISTFDTSSHSLISFSVGYFLYDMWDMIKHNPSRGTYEILIHHVVILVCFSIAIATHMYVGYAVVSLVIELNSIFLHIRQLLQILGFKKDNSMFRCNSVINLGTFVLFRITVMCWMSRWLIVNKDSIPLVFYSVGSLGLATMTVINIILFYRLLQSDFLRKREASKKDN